MQVENFQTMKTNIFCALSFCNRKSTGTLMLFCSDCSLFFQFSIISIFSPLVGFANLIFLLCVFRLVGKKKTFLDLNLFVGRCIPFRYSS